MAISKHILTTNMFTTFIYVAEISADLFQSSSVLAYSSSPQDLPILTAASPRCPPILTSIQVSQHLSIPGCLDAWIPCTILKGQHFRGTGRHRLPDLLVQNPANLPKSVLPPAQECQMAQLGALPEPVEPKCSHKLAGTIPSDTTGDPRHPKCNPNWCQICHQATQRQASEHPSIQASGPRGRRQRR